MKQKVMNWMLQAGSGKLEGKRWSSNFPLPNSNPFKAISDDLKQHGQD
jgi:hypothetical protein